MSHTRNRSKDQVVLSFVALGGLLVLVQGCGSVETEDAMREESAALTDTGTYVQGNAVLIGTAYRNFKWEKATGNIRYDFDGDGVVEACSPQECNFGAPGDTVLNPQFAGLTGGSGGVFIQMFCVSRGSTTFCDLNRDLNWSGTRDNFWEMNYHGADLEVPSSVFSNRRDWRRFTDNCHAATQFQIEPGWATLEFDANPYVGLNYECMIYANSETPNRVKAEHVGGYRHRCVYNYKNRRGHLYGYSAHSETLEKCSAEDGQTAMVSADIGAQAVSAIDVQSAGEAVGSPTFSLSVSVPAGQPRPEVSMTLSYGGPSDYLPLLASVWLMTQEGGRDVYRLTKNGTSNVAKAPYREQGIVGNVTWKFRSPSEFKATASASINF